MAGPPYGEIYDLMEEGKIVPFLGAGVNFGTRQPPNQSWDVKSSLRSVPMSGRHKDSKTRRDNHCISPLRGGPRTNARGAKYLPHQALIQAGPSVENILARRSGLTSVACF
jgi:hypothetical protein